MQLLRAPPAPRTAQPPHPGPARPQPRYPKFPHDPTVQVRSRRGPSPSPHRSVPLHRADLPQTPLPSLGLLPVDQGANGRACPTLLNLQDGQTQMPLSFPISAINCERQSPSACLDGPPAPKFAQLARQSARSADVLQPLRQPSVFLAPDCDLEQLILVPFPGFATNRRGSPAFLPSTCGCTGDRRAASKRWCPGCATGSTSHRVVNRTAD